MIVYPLADSLHSTGQEDLADLERGVECADVADGDDGGGGFLLADGLDGCTGIVDAGAIGDEPRLLA